jgi:hypothetical protein
VQRIEDPTAHTCLAARARTYLLFTIMSQQALRPGPPGDRNANLFVSNVNGCNSGRAWRSTNASGPETDMVEPVGIEPTTPCLQSRCSPS